METVRIIGPNRAALAWLTELTRCLSLLEQIIPCPVELREVIGRCRC